MQGCYKFINVKSPDIRILASGLTLRFAISAAETLKTKGINAEVWSITSFNELARGGIDSDRDKIILDNDSESYVEKCFSNELPTVAVSEYMRSYSEQIRKWVNGTYICLGTDGYGRSDTRDNLRSFFEIDEKFIVYSCLVSMNKRKDAKGYAKENNLMLNTKHPWKR